MSNSIEVSGLKKYFGSVKAVDDISFQVEKGTIFGMLGPNGAGKSTTIETMVGLNKRNGGEIKVLGLDPENSLDQLKKKIGVQLQNPSLFPRLTVKEMVKLFASFYPDPHSIDRVIERVGLEAKANAQTAKLSGGQKHRLAIALAMVSNGEIIFLDEPTTGLDPQARRQLWEVILELKKEGVTVFLTTHYMDEAEKLCDNLVIIDYGKIIAEGTPQELISENFKEKAIEFANPGFSAEESNELINKLQEIISNFEKEDDMFIFYTSEISRAISIILEYAEGAQKTIDDILVRQATLEDVFLKLTGRGIRE